MIMRADRLVSLLMLLQSRGRTSAPELARELEVSERTIHRDILALGMAGVPVFATTGRGGGFELVESYRTNLTGLTTAEIQALSMINVPSPLVELGIAGDMKSALLKLAAALPSTYREQEGFSRQRIHLDSSPWEGDSRSLPQLETVYQAVLHDKRIKISFASLNQILIESCVEPYGLVAKGGVWYLVYQSNGKWQAKRVSDLVSAEAVNESFVRRTDFNLVDFWEGWCLQRQINRQSFHVTARIDPAMLPWLPMYFDLTPRVLEAPGAPGEWPTLELSFNSIYDARSRLLGMGGAVEVLSPQALRQSLRDFAEQAVKVNS